MKKIFLLALAFTTLYSINVNAQAKEEKKEKSKINLKVSGFVNSQMMYDTRKNVEAREGMLILYPLNENIAADGTDLNIQNAFNHLAMISRLRFAVTGPDILNAKVSSLIESDYSGASNIENNSFRLRHAYVKMSWAKSELIMGQYWHPINVPEMLPRIASLNTGAPFHPFSRHVQLRLDRKFGKWKLIGVLANQRDFASPGPSGSSSIYMRNAALPNGHLQLQYAKNKLFFGLAGDVKALKPNTIFDNQFISTDSLYPVNDLVYSYAATAFANYKGKKLDVKVQSVWGQNMTEHLMMGGYAISDVDTVAKSISYTTADQISVWTNIWTKRDKFNYGIFAGYMKNLGSAENRVGTNFYGRGADIDHMYRVSPMVSFTKDNLCFLAEVEYTVAAYGTANTLGEVKVDNTADNIRALMTVTYTF